MADQIFTDPTDYFLLSGISFENKDTGAPANEGDADSVMTWTSADRSVSNFDLTDVSGDGVLLDGTDYWFGTFLVFTGYTIDVDGVNYPVFSDGGGTFAVVVPEGSPTSFLDGISASNPYNASESNAFLCFAAGTAITCPEGARAVETLSIGDRVLNTDGRAVPVTWIGRQTVSTRFHPADRLMPVCIAAGALGNGLPERDLTLTADHALLVDGLLVNAGALVNGTTITRVPLSEFGGSYTVYHIETEDHDLILAEGTPAETFVDYVGRQAFDNYDEYLALYGDDRTIREMPAPRISTARMLPPALKRRLGLTEAA